MPITFQRNNQEVTLKIPLSEAKAKIAERIIKGKELLQKQVQTREQLAGALLEKEKWHAANTFLIEQSFSGTAILYDYDPPFGVVFRI